MNTVHSDWIVQYSDGSRSNMRWLQDEDGLLGIRFWNLLIFRNKQSKLK